MMDWGNISLSIKVKRCSGAPLLISGESDFIRHCVIWIWSERSPIFSLPFCSPRLTEKTPLIYSSFWCIRWEGRISLSGTLPLSRQAVMRERGALLHNRVHLLLRRIRFLLLRIRLLLLHIHLFAPPHSFSVPPRCENEHYSSPQQQCAHFT